MKKPDAIENRPDFLPDSRGGGYRSLCRAGDLVVTRLKEKESDLMILAPRDCSEPARRILCGLRRQIEEYIRRKPDFARSLLPVRVGEGAPLIVREMAAAGARCGVGPMAAVAGALAYQVGRELGALFGEVIIENGGDIYLASPRRRTVALFAGEGHPLSGRLGIAFAPEEMPLGVATSSKTVGPSLSWGRAEAALVAADTPTLADAAATALGNRLVSAERVVRKRALDFIRAIPGVRGAVIVIGETLEAWGRIELVRLELPAARTRLK